MFSDNLDLYLQPLLTNLDLKYGNPNDVLLPNTISRNHIICGATEKPPLMILDSVEPHHFGLCRGHQVGDAQHLLSLMCTPRVSVGGLKMGVVNVVAHRYEHFGMHPTLSGGKPDRAGPTQPFVTE